jgi:hypothetical protein
MVTLLEAARPAFLGLHATLLQAERRERERLHGTLPRGAWYNAVLEDESLAWLRPFGQFVAGLDAAMAEAVRTEVPLTPDELAGFVRQARACLVPGPRYLELLQAYPEVIIAHRDARRTLEPLVPAARPPEGETA